MSYLANASVRAKLLGAFGIVLTILIVLSSAAYRTTSLNQEATGAVIHAFQVIGTANALLANLVDMETGYRGYLLAGDDAFLEPYWRGSPELDAEIAQLQALTADNPTQVARWRSIQTQVDEWRQLVTEPGIALRREISAGRAPPDALTRWVGSGEGRRRFATIRATFNEALAVEEQLLGQRQAEAAAASERLQVVLIVGTIVAVGLAIGLALLLTADIVEPITRLATTAGVIASGKLDQRIGLHRGDEIGAASVAFDRMAEQLQATIVRSRAILDTAAEGIVGLDQTGRVVFANPAAVQMVGLPEATMVEQSAIPWIEPDQPPSPSDAGRPEGRGPAVRGRGVGGEGNPAAGGEEFSGSPVAAALDFGSVEHGAGDLVRGDGSRLPIDYACAPIHDAGGIVGAVLTFRDVTERRAAQRELEERARELARSNADLEQFAYVASHDLQEPLRAVVSYLQLLERRYGDQLDERAERYIGYAVDGGRRMQTLITDLLTFSRVSRRDVTMEPVDLESVLERVEASLQVAIEESGATVTHDPLPTVAGDSTQLTQLFQNLVGNAIKFRGEAPPEIHVSAERGAEPGAERQDGAWRFSVRDNGIGIAPEYHERVFILFQRLHARDEYGGTGIGLAVCKKIVERRGGTIWVDATPGGGSTIRFTIPDAGAETA
jgi:signal transduction histidine kinase/CHASE3 domain sensor protein